MRRLAWVLAVPLTALYLFLCSACLVFLLWVLLVGFKVWWEG